MREFIDGFETGDFGLWDNLIGSGINTTPASASGLYGAKAAVINNGSSIVKNLTARDTYYFAFKVRFVTIGNTPVMTISNDSTVLGTLKLTSGGNLQLNSGAATVCATGTKTLVINTTYLIEVMYQPKTDSTGKFVVKVDGITDYDFTGVTSPNALQVNRFSLGGSVTELFDDVIVESSSWIGPSKIQALVPIGAGTTTQWTPSSGANYTCVDEVPASDTDYVVTNTAANIDTYALSDLTGTIGSVKSVQLVVRSSYSGAPSTTSLKGVIRSGGTNYPSSSTIALSTSPTPYASLWENDPATSTPWTASGVNSMEAGIKAV